MSVTIGGVSPTPNQIAEFWDVFGLVTEQDFYPYVLRESTIPATDTLVIQLPTVLAQFPQRQVEVESMAYSAPAMAITDVWITPNNGYLFHSVGLSEWSSMPRYDNYVHLMRLQTSASKIQGFYPRRSTYPIFKVAPPRPIDYSDVATQYVVPQTFVPWVDNAPVVLDAVYESTLGDLWRCVVAGVVGGGIASPIYTEEMNSGFAIMTSGTASFQFMGRAAYQGAWRVSPKAGIQWYFAAIAGGLLADTLPAEAKGLIQAMAFHCVNNWISGIQYEKGQKVGGSMTRGMVWEANNTGTTSGVIPFPMNATVGVTCIDGGVIWRCIGAFAHASQRFFWYDTDPTQKIAKSPDSHDSYAACFIWLVQRYLSANPTDVAWLDAISPQYGLTYDGFIREVIYANLLTQVTANNLTNTFQGTGVPFGGNYDANFLMDNCEVWAGLKSAQLIYSLYKVDNGYSDYIGIFADQILSGISALWEPETKTFKYVAGLASMEPTTETNTLFYPLVMSQGWPALWGVPVEQAKKLAVFDYMNDQYGKWWARNDLDDLLACGAHYALTTVDRSAQTKAEILKRIELERLPTGQADMYIHDVAYYLVMRDALVVKDLMTPFAVTGGTAQVEDSNRVVVNASRQITAADHKKILEVQQAGIVLSVGSGTLPANFFCVFSLQAGTTVFSFGAGTTCNDLTGNITRAASSNKFVGLASRSTANSFDLDGV